MFRQGQCKLIKSALTQNKQIFSSFSLTRLAALHAGTKTSQGCSDQSTALFTAAVVACAVISHQVHSQVSATCDEALIPPWTKSESSATVCPNRKPRNVMLHRFRSNKARHLPEKYDVDWNTVLGFGTYGAVYSGKKSSNGERVALKVIAKKNTDQSSFRRETAALLRVFDNGGHPNISGLRDVYEDDNYYYLVLDLICGGEIFDHLVNDGVFSEDNAVRLMREAASALSFLHSIGVVHADLKPENLMLCSARREYGSLKIIDFGSARVTDDNHYCLDVQGKPSPPKSEESTGTVAYWAPERFVKGSEATPAMDMWSTGIILYIMLTGVHPFDPEGCACDEEIEERIKSNPKAPQDAKCMKRLSPTAIDLIQKLMEPDPSLRLDAAGMLNHSWIKRDATEPPKLYNSPYTKVSTGRNIL